MYHKCSQCALVYETELPQVFLVVYQHVMWFVENQFSVMTSNICD